MSFCVLRTRVCCVLNVGSYVFNLYFETNIKQSEKKSEADGWLVLSVAESSAAGKRDRQRRSVRVFGLH